MPISGASLDYKRTHFFISDEEKNTEKITVLLFVSQFNLECSIKKLQLCYVVQTLLNINTQSETLHNFH